MAATRNRRPGTDRPRTPRADNRKWKIAGGAAIAVGVIIVLAVQLSRGPARLDGKFEQVRVGMNASEAAAVMGPPHEKAKDLLVWRASGVTLGSRGVRRHSSGNVTYALWLEDGTVKHKKRFAHFVETRTLQQEGPDAW